MNDLLDALRSYWTRLRAWWDRLTRDRSPSPSLWDRGGEIHRKLTDDDHPLE